jgi:hypothetical protein
MRRLMICFVLFLCAGCGTPAATTPAPTQVARLAERPTVTPGAAATSATATPARFNGQQASIVFEAPEEGSLRAITAQGVLRELADPTGNSHRVPWSPSPDGRTVAVVVLAGKSPKGGFSRATLWTAGIDESNPTQLLDLTHPDIGQLDSIEAASLDSALSNPFFQRLAWTPDGTQIIVASAHEGQVDLYAVPVAGGAPRRLTDTPALEFAPQLSPDGRRLAYASASSFGTGAGWADPAAWVQELAGSAPQPLVSQAGGGGSVELAGWIDNDTAIALLHDGGPGGTSVWARQGDAAPRQLHASPGGGVRWDLRPGQFAFAVTDQTHATPTGATWVWDGVAPDPSELPNGAATQVILSPDPELLLLCEDNGSGQPNRSIWRAGQRVQFGAGDCNGGVAWADDGTLAIGSGTDLTQAGSIVGPDGGVREQGLPEGALLAGWVGADLYFFAPGAGASGSSTGWTAPARMPPSRSASRSPTSRPRPKSC